MAFNFNKYNKGTKILRAGVDNTDFDFVKLSSFEGEDVPVDGFFFTEGYNEGEKQVVIVGSGVNINMPGRATEIFEELAADPEAVEAVLNGELYLTDIHLIPAKDKKKKDTYSFKLVNADQIEK